VNITGIIGIVLAVLGLLIIIAPNTLNILVAIAFIGGGLFLAFQGFSGNR
jgi:hypothetical protein